MISFCILVWINKKFVFFLGRSGVSTEGWGNLPKFSPTQLGGWLRTAGAGRHPFLLAAGRSYLHGVQQQQRQPTEVESGMRHGEYRTSDYGHRPHFSDFDVVNGRQRQIDEDAASTLIPRREWS
jgi:hypothetical protein